MTHPLRIVIADDEAEIREYFRRLLSRLGHAVVAEATTGQELVDACGREHPDLVITDFMMPGMDGLTAAAEISKSSDVPIVVVSAHDPPQDQLDSVAEFLVKPIAMADLEAAIDRAVAN